MRKSMKTLLTALLVLSLTACSTGTGGEAVDNTTQPQEVQPTEIPETSAPVSEVDDSEETGEQYMKIQAGDYTFTATLADNTSAQALVEMLQDGPVTVSMQDYGSMEKVGSLGQSLPRNDEQITTEAGDIILYQGNMLVIYYAPNSWNFTRLGKIENVTKKDLLKAFGNGSVKITLSLD